MNNDNTIKVMNENGAVREYGRVPDLWHHAMKLADEGDRELSEAVLKVWHMAHDLKAIAEEQGKARIIDAVKNPS